MNLSRSLSKMGSLLTMLYCFSTWSGTLASTVAGHYRKATISEAASDSRVWRETGGKGRGQKSARGWAGGRHGSRCCVRAICQSGGWSP
jgi:hypothetical protein